MTSIVLIDQSLIDDKSQNRGGSFVPQLKHPVLSHLHRSAKSN